MNIVKSILYFLLLFLFILHLMKKALITGISGQDGAYLSKLLIEKGYKVTGITRDINTVNLIGLTYLNIVNDVKIIALDLSDENALKKIIVEEEPDEIYNLAAQSSVGLSYTKPVQTLKYNILSSVNILETIRLYNPLIKFYQASSSEMFGNIQPEKLPIRENLIFHPVSPYAVSKASAHWMAVNYREAYNIYSCCGILFNHESPLRGDNFVIKKILNTAVRIKLRLEHHPLRLGNLLIQRDFGYAPKYVEAMWLMMQQEKPDDYLICSGTPLLLKTFVEKIFEKLNLDYNKYVTIDPNLFRPLDLEIIYGDNSKAKKNLNWDYNYSTNELIENLINDEIKFLQWLIK